MNKEHKVPGITIQRICFGVKQGSHQLKPLQYECNQFHLQCVQGQLKWSHGWITLTGNESMKCVGLLHCLGNNTAGVGVEHKLNLHSSLIQQSFA